MSIFHLSFLSKTTLALALGGLGLAGAAQAHPGKHSSKRAAKMARFDLNQDGKLSPDERMAIKKQRFTKLDANGDGSVSLEEMRQAHAQKRANRRARARARGKLQGRTPGKARARKMRRKARGHRGKRFQQRFAKRDLDKSGSLSWEEFAAPRARGKALGHGKRGPGKMRGNGNAWGKGKRRGPRGSQ